MRTRGSALAFKLSSAIEEMKKFKYLSAYDSAPTLVPVCTCPEGDGELLYDADKDMYTCKGYCHLNRVCARIQRDKHQLLIRKRYTEPLSVYYDSVSNNKLTQSLTGSILNTSQNQLT